MYLTSSSGCGEALTQPVRGSVARQLANTQTHTEREGKREIVFSFYGLYITSYFGVETGYIDLSVQ